MSNDGASEIEQARESARNALVNNEPLRGGGLGRSHSNANFFGVFRSTTGNSLPIGVWCISVPTGMAKMEIPVLSSITGSTFFEDIRLR